MDEFISSYKNCKFVYINKFLEHLKNKQNLKNWVDIEEEYFNKLKICFQNYGNGKNLDSLTKLNEDFAQIKNDLEEYLCGQNKENILLKNNRLVL